MIASPDYINQLKRSGINAYSIRRFSEWIDTAGELRDKVDNKLAELKGRTP